MKTFFGSTFIEKDKLEEEGRKNPIKFEYYKQINEDDINSENKAKYGIHIVKTEYLPDNIKVETKCIKYVTNDELEEDRILKIFKESKVSTINCEDIISDLKKDFSSNIKNSI